MGIALKRTRIAQEARLGGKSTLATRQKALDRIFGQWVRRSAAGHMETANCITCGKPGRWDDTDHFNAGHFWKRQHQSTRYDPRNCHFQCVSCNHHRGGAEAEHAAYILKTYGKEVFDELEQRHRQIKKWRADEIESLIAYYKQKIKELD